MSRRRKWTTGIALAFLAIFAFLSYCFRLKGVDIGNGWRMEFVAAGAEQIQYHSESAIATRIRNATPIGMQVLLEVQPTVSVNYSEKGGLMLMFLEYSPAHLKPTPESLPRPLLEVIDDRGVKRLWRPEGQSNSGNARVHGMLYTDQDSTQYGPLLHFRVLSEDGNRVLIERTIPNPGYKTKRTNP